MLFIKISVIHKVIIAVSTGNSGRGQNCSKNPHSEITKRLVSYLLPLGSLTDIYSLGFFLL